MRILKIIFVTVLVLGMGAVPGYAAVTAGVEWRYQNEERTLETFKFNWEFWKRWSFQTTYNMDQEELSAGITRKTRINSTFQPYLGLGVRDVLENSETDLSWMERTEIIGGIALNFGSNSGSGVVVTMEAKIVPSTIFDHDDEPLLKPILSVGLNYRFSGGGFSSSGSTRIETPDNISNSDYDLLARLVTAEAGGEPYRGQVAVAAVVLNRVRSFQFPNSIRDVIYQRGQFSSLNKLPSIMATESCRRAVTEALTGSDPTRGALYFYNPRTCSPEGLAFFRSGKLRPTVEIGNHIFLVER